MSETDSSTRRRPRLPAHLAEVQRAIVRAHMDDDWPSRRKTLFFNCLHALSELTGIPRTPRPGGRPSKTYDLALYRKAVRALGAAADECPPVKELLRLTDKYFRPATLRVTVANGHYTSLGIHDGDVLECERAVDLRDGELAALCGSGFHKTPVGRLGCFDGGRFSLTDNRGQTFYTPTPTAALYRVVKVIEGRRDKGGGGWRSELRELRRRLRSLSEPRDEGKRFRVARELYDRERRASDEEWPEYIPG